MLIFGRRQLRQPLGEYAHHDSERRPHRVALPTVCQHPKILTEVRFVLVEPLGTARRYRSNDACVGCFPFAADIVMGRPVPTPAEVC